MERRGRVLGSERKGRNLKEGRGRGRARRALREEREGAWLGEDREGWKRRGRALSSKRRGRGRALEEEREGSERGERGLREGRGFREKGC